MLKFGLQKIFPAVLLVLLVGCQSYRGGEGRTMGEYTDDVGIRAAVKAALVRDAEVKGMRITVNVRKGVVSLYGRVPSTAARQRVVGIAATARGVVEVKDKLTLVSEP